MNQAEHKILMVNYHIKWQHAQLRSLTWNKQHWAADLDAGFCVHLACFNATAAVVCFSNILKMAVYAAGRRWQAVIGVTGAAAKPVSLPAVPPRSLNY